jgi:hypothetical protein
LRADDVLFNDFSSGPILKIEKLWFPLLKYILRTQFKNKQELKVAIDRTQWRDKNVFMISLIWDKRALPLYWQILPSLWL